MKKLMLVALMLGSFTIQAQTLKGITLGEKSNGKMIQTTVAGIKGVITPQTLNDGRIYQLIFLPSENGKTVNRISMTDLGLLKKGLEEKYGIKLIPISDKTTGDLTSLYTSDFKFMITVDVNEFLTPSYKIALIITDNKLIEIHKREAQAKASQDF